MTKEKTKICMITISPLDADTRILNEAQSLAKLFNVTILTSEYLTKNKPIFTVKVGFKKISSKFLALFTLGYLAFKEKPDVYHAHDLHGLLVAFLPSLIKNKILVYDSHELWSDMTLPGNWKILAGPFRLLEKILMVKVSQIITVNLSLARYLAKKYHRPTIDIYNMPALSRAKGGKRLIDMYPGKKIVFYLGAFRYGRALLKILDAAQLLDKSYQILFIGYGPWKEKVKQAIRARNLNSYVDVLDKIAPEHIINVVTGSHIGLCLIENVSRSYYYSTPNKLFQYIGARVPVLGSNFPEFKRIIIGNNIGEVVNPSSPKAIAEKIKEMTNRNKQVKYRKNLAKIGRSKYSWETESKKLIKMYLKLTKNVK